MLFATIVRILCLTVTLWAVFSDSMAVKPSKQGYDDWEEMLKNASHSKNPGKMCLNQLINTRDWLCMQVKCKMVMHAGKMQNGNACR